MHYFITAIKSELTYSTNPDYFSGTSRIIYERACCSPFPRNRFSRVNPLEVNFSANERSVQCHSMTYTSTESISEMTNRYVSLLGKSPKEKFGNSRQK